MKVTIRPITKGDLEWARMLRNANRELFFDSQIVSRTKHEQWFQALSYPFFIIELEGKRIGTVAISKVSSGHEIHNVLIGKDYRSQGVFKRVLAILVKRYGVPLFVDVKPENQKAIRAYMRLGFTPSSLRMQKG